MARRAETRFRFAVDTGGTFTDLMVEDRVGAVRAFKRPTTPDDPVVGLLDVLGAAADEYGLSLSELLGSGDQLIHGTTRATNAIVTGSTAKTALLATRGHPDILLFREGGERLDPYDYTITYPDPYIPRSLTFEVDERIWSDGRIDRDLDEANVHATIAMLSELQVEAVAVCLLWSIVNPTHELRVGELLAASLPGVPYTLSHDLNPTLREYRRACSAAVDASLRPLMSTYIRSLDARLKDEGFKGRLLMLTSAGGVADAASVARSPIHTINSGPSAAPVAGRHFARLDSGSDTAVVTDAGGTTFDVGLIRNGTLPWTRETRIGELRQAFLTGFPSVDVRSVGAGGGSIAWVDEAGLLHVGPESAGAQPGPACYARGGLRATVTDACVVLGYIDPALFLGGHMSLDADLARDAVVRDVATPLSLSLHEAAAAIVQLACERMANLIEEITLIQGVDARAAPMIAGGGGGGLYAVAIARRIGSPVVVVPAVASTLSAAGALMSDIQTRYAQTSFTTTDSFDVKRVNDVLMGLEAAAVEFTQGPGAGAAETSIDYFVEARYPFQVWEIPLPLRSSRLAETHLPTLRSDFHRLHEEIFAIKDTSSEVELVTWSVTVRCRIRSGTDPDVAGASGESGAATVRNAFFSGYGLRPTAVYDVKALAVGRPVSGPVLIEGDAESIVIPPRAAAELLPSGSLRIVPDGASDANEEG